MPVQGQDLIVPQRGTAAVAVAGGCCLLAHLIFFFFFFITLALATCTALICTGTSVSHV